VDVALPTSMVMNTLEPHICLAEQGLGIACIPDTAIRKQLEGGSLVSVLDDYMETCTMLRVLWPSSRHLSPKLRAFVDFVADKLLEPPTS
jgi:DNA-binding transcriptional LysR family regulator